MKLRRIFASLLILCCLSQETFAQKSSESEDEYKAFNFVPVPYLTYNRSIGFALGALPMAMVDFSKEDTISPASNFGLLGMYTTNETWFTIGFAKLYWDQDTWRGTVAAGTGNINFQFYLSGGIDRFIPYTATPAFVLLEIQRQIFPHIYLGVNYTFNRFKNEFELPLLPSIEQELHGVGLILSSDSRNSQYYATKGHFGNLRWDSYPSFFGNEQVSNRLRLDYSQYFALNKRSLVAARLFAGIGLGNVIFNHQFIMGATDIRGYTQGEHRGDQQLTLQGEYRHNFKDSRWGAVGFVGFGTLWNTVDAPSENRIFPGAGVGFRYLVFEEEEMRVGMDAAVGDGDWGIYFRIGEAF
jgi:outer membrane protein assembly factor BamA